MSEPFVLPAIQFQQATGQTMDEMRKNLDPDFIRQGDAILVWVNEGTFWLQNLEWYPKQKPIDEMTAEELRAALRKERPLAP